MSSSIFYRKGVVEAFLAVVVQYPEVRSIIQNKTIVFGKDSGVGIRGEISLYSGEVRNNWLNVIKTAPDYDKQLESLPMWERYVDVLKPFMSFIGEHYLFIYVV